MAAQKKIIDTKLQVRVENTDAAKKAIKKSELQPDQADRDRSPASRSGNGDRRTYAVHPLRHPRDRHQRTRRCDLTTGRQRGCEEMNPHFFTAPFCAFCHTKQWA